MIKNKQMQKVEENLVKIKCSFKNFKRVYYHITWREMCTEAQERKTVYYYLFEFFIHYLNVLQVSNTHFINISEKK